MGQQRERMGSCCCSFCVFRLDVISVLTIISGSAIILDVIIKLTFSNSI